MKLAKMGLAAFSVVFLMIPGFIFTLQGANVIRSSSPMTGDPLWIAIGLGMLVAGGVVFYFANRKPPASA